MILLIGWEMIDFLLTLDQFKKFNVVLKIKFSMILIKPQFEDGKSRLGKGAIVSYGVREEVLQEVLDWFKEHGHSVDKLCESPITGKAGNTEYLALVRGAPHNENV